MVIRSRNNFPNVDPTAMKRRGKTAGRLGFPAEPNHFTLELASESCTLQRQFVKQSSQTWLGSSFGSGSKSLLAVFTSFDEVVQNRNGIARSSSHGMKSPRMIDSGQCLSFLRIPG